MLKTMYLSKRLNNYQNPQSLTLKQQGVFQQAFYFAICFICLFYLLADKPEILIASITALTITYSISNAVEFLSLKLFKRKFRVSKWRLFTMASAVCLTVIVFDTATVAQVFQDTETELEGIVDNADGVADFFSMLRIMLIVGTTAGVGFAIYQGWRSSDYTGVAIGLGVGVLGIITITIFQSLILGN